jgi:hypothetical protein
MLASFEVVCAHEGKRARLKSECTFSVFLLRGGVAVTGAEESEALNGLIVIKYTPRPIDSHASFSLGPKRDTPFFSMEKKRKELTPEELHEMAADSRSRGFLVRYKCRDGERPWVEETPRFETAGSEIVVVVGKRTVLARGPRGTPETTLWTAAADRALQMAPDDIY